MSLLTDYFNPLCDRKGLIRLAGDALAVDKSLSPTDHVVVYLRLIKPNPDPHYYDMLVKTLISRHPTIDLKADVVLNRFKAADVPPLLADIEQVYDARLKVHTTPDTREGLTNMQEYLLMMVTSNPKLTDVISDLQGLMTQRYAALPLTPPRKPLIHTTLMAPLPIGPPTAPRPARRRMVMSVSPVFATDTTTVDLIHLQFKTVPVVNEVFAHLKKNPTPE